MNADERGWALREAWRWHNAGPCIIGLLVAMFILRPIEAASQVRSFDGLRKKSIRLLSIDTSNAVVLETPQALIYFSRTDVIDRVVQLSKVLDLPFDQELAMLRNEMETIHVHRDSIYDPTGEGLHIRPSGKDKRDQVGWVLALISPDLLLDGKALPVNSKTGVPARRRIRSAVEGGSQEKGLWLPPGNRNLVFRFKDGTEIHRIVTAFGE